MPKTLSASAGNRAEGIPKIIATRSAENSPITSRFRRTYAIAWAGAPHPRTTPCPSGGGCGDSRETSAAAGRQPAASNTNTQLTPTLAMASPASAGPTIAADWSMTWLSDIAEGRRGRGTSLGTVAALADWSSVDAADVTTTTA